MPTLTILLHRSAPANHGKGEILAQGWIDDDGSHLVTMTDLYMAIDRAIEIHRDEHEPVVSVEARVTI